MTRPRKKNAKTWRQERIGSILTDAYEKLAALKDEPQNHLDLKYLQNVQAGIRGILRQLGMDPFIYTSKRRKMQEEEEQEVLQLNPDAKEEQEEEATPKLNPKRLTKEQASQIKEAYKEGLEMEQISDRVNISLEKVQSYIEKQGKEKLLADD